MPCQSQLTVEALSDYTSQNDSEAQSEVDLNKEANLVAKLKAEAVSLNP